MQNNMLEELKKKMEDPQFVQDMIDYFDKYENRKQEKEERLLSNFEKRFHHLSNEEKVRLIDLWETKYHSQEYLDREYKKGRMPEKRLEYSLFLYCKKYGEEVEIDEFCATECYKLDKVCTITEFNGQGTVYVIDY